MDSNYFMFGIFFAKSSKNPKKRVTNQRVCLKMVFNQG